MQQQPAPHLGQRLLESYDEMPRAERRLADLILEDVGALRHFTALELSARAGVSKATAARLFRRIGYGCFKAAQKEIREGGRGVALEPAQAEAVDRGDRPSPSVYLDAEVKHLVRTFEVQRADELEQTARMLRQGEKLWVVGFGDDYPLVHFARAMLIKLRPDVRMIPIVGFPIPEEFASISAKDTVLALAVGRKTQALRNIIGSFARAGASVILVTDRVTAKERAVASAILRCRSTGPTLFPSMTSAISLLTYLCASLAVLIGYPAVERLRMIETIHREWGDAMEP